MRLFLIENYANASQPYSFARPTKKTLKAARITIAGCINADAEEISFTLGGTESDNWAIKSSYTLKENKKAIITSQIEHHAILNACESIEEAGRPVAYLPVDYKGGAQPSYLQNIIFYVY